MNIKEHDNWLQNEKISPGSLYEICQCGTEKIIKKSSNPDYMRAVLLSYVFIDQFIYTHYNQVHNEFKNEFSGPKLRAHSFGGYASPSWFLFSRRGQEVTPNWDVIITVFQDYLQGTFIWLKQKIDLLDDKYWGQIKMEIQKEFKEQDQKRLINSLPRSSNK